MLTKYVFNYFLFLFHSSSVINHLYFKRSHVKFVTYLIASGIFMPRIHKKNPSVLLSLSLSFLPVLVSKNIDFDNHRTSFIYVYKLLLSSFFVPSVSCNWRRTLRPHISKYIRHSIAYTQVKLCSNTHLFTRYPTYIAHYQAQPVYVFVL